MRSPPSQLSSISPLARSRRTGRSDKRRSVNSVVLAFRELPGQASRRSCYVPPGQDTRAGAERLHRLPSAIFFQARALVFGRGVIDELPEVSAQQQASPIRALPHQRSGDLQNGRRLVEGKLLNHQQHEGCAVFGSEPTQRSSNSFGNVPAASQRVYVGAIAWL